MRNLWYPSVFVLLLVQVACFLFIFFVDIFLLLTPEVVRFDQNKRRQRDFLWSQFKGNSVLIMLVCLIQPILQVKSLSKKKTVLS